MARARNLHRAAEATSVEAGLRRFLDDASWEDALCSGFDERERTSVPIAWAKLRVLAEGARRASEGA